MSEGKENVNENILCSSRRGAEEDTMRKTGTFIISSPKKKDSIGISRSLIAVKGCIN